jgi:hypothetical protein
MPPNGTERFAPPAGHDFFYRQARNGSCESFEMLGRKLAHYSETISNQPIRLAPSKASLPATARSSTRVAASFAHPPPGPKNGQRR